MKLAVPTMMDEADVMEMRREFLQSGEQLMGAGGLERYESYADWLRQIQDTRAEQTFHPELPPATVLLCRQEEKLIGIVEIRHRLTDFQLQYGGQIGLSIRPGCRAHGISAQVLALALAECRNLGLTRVLMIRRRRDADARAAIEANGGILENESAYEGDILCRYWIEIPAAMCRPLRIDELDRKLFSGFIRRQQVTMCRRRIGVSWHMAYCPFVDDWTEEQFISQINDLQTVLRGGGAVFGAFMDGALKGFAAVSARPLGPDDRYRDLLSLHVSADCRGRGLGTALFREAARWACDDGADKLYISAHSAQETQAFYAAMGCVDTLWPSPEHVALEPFDCQLEYTLTTDRRNKP